MSKICKRGHQSSTQPGGRNSQDYCKECRRKPKTTTYAGRKANSRLQALTDLKRKPNAVKKLEREQAKAERLRIEAENTAQRLINVNADTVLKEAEKIKRRVAAGYNVLRHSERPRAVLEAVAAATPPPAPTEAQTMMAPDPKTGEPRLVEYTMGLKDGQVIRIPGNPVRDWVLPKTPTVAPAETATVAPTTRTNMPPWIQRGDMQARDKAEWLAWQEQRSADSLTGCEVAAPDPVRHGNGVGEVPALNGMRLSYEDPRGGWRSVGPHPNWDRRSKL